MDKAIKNQMIADSMDAVPTRNPPVGTGYIPSAKVGFI